MSKENYIKEIRPHDSAYKHVSGYAEYTDDINEPRNIKQAHYNNADQLQVIFSIHRANIFIQNKKKAP